LPSGTRRIARDAAGVLWQGWETLEEAREGE